MTWTLDDKDGKPITEYGVQLRRWNTKNRQENNQGFCERNTIIKDSIKDLSTRRCCTAFKLIYRIGVILQTDWHIFLLLYRKSLSREIARNTERSGWWVALLSYSFRQYIGKYKKLENSFKCLLRNVEMTKTWVPIFRGFCREIDLVIYWKTSVYPNYMTIL